MLRNTLIAGGWLLLMAGSVLGQGTVTGEQICGPRCVEFILNEYGQPIELADLIHEMQGGQADRMVSAATIAETLEAKGIHARILQLDHATVPDWPHPVVLHLIQPHGSGHFIVVMPRESGNPSMIWNSGKFSETLTDEERDGLTGVVVLTSPESFGKETTLEMGTRTTQSSSTLTWVGGGLLGAVGMVLIGWITMRRRVSTTISS